MDKLSDAKVKYLLRILHKSAKSIWKPKVYKPHSWNCGKVSNIFIINRAAKMSSVTDRRLIWERRT
eukprot:c53623_g1_i1 orf=155-352(+)